MMSDFEFYLLLCGFSFLIGLSIGVVFVHNAYEDCDCGGDNE